MAIYTKTGDNGTTSIVGGSRIAKHDLQLEVYGTIDELNAFVGLAFEEAKKSVEILLPELEPILSQLFVIGGMVATETSLWTQYWNPEEVKAFVSWLESRIDKLTGELPQQRAFILPAGSEMIARLHVCRTITRRVERHLCAFTASSSSYESISQYFNRLSDFFYVLARYSHKIQEKDEIIWKSEK